MVLENVLAPEKVLSLARSVEEAAVMVMSAVPLKEAPLMVRAVSSAVAVAALPPMERVLVAAKARAEPSLFEYKRLFPVHELVFVPPFAIATMPVTLLAVPPMLSELGGTEWVRPELAPTRPERVPMLTGFWKVWVPAQVLLVEVPNAMLMSGVAPPVETIG